MSCFFVYVVGYLVFPCELMHNLTNSYVITPDALLLHVAIPPIGLRGRTCVSAYMGVCPRASRLLYEVCAQSQTAVPLLGYLGCH